MHVATNTKAGGRTYRRTTKRQAGRERDSSEKKKQERKKQTKQETKLAISPHCGGLHCLHTRGEWTERRVEWCLHTRGGW